MRWITFLLLMFSGLIFSCQQGENNNSQQNRIKSGIWVGTLKTQGIEIPFLFEVEESGGVYTVILKNADERIPINDVEITEDCLAGRAPGPEPAVPVLCRKEPSRKRGRLP